MEQKFGIISCLIPRSIVYQFCNFNNIQQWKKNYISINFYKNNKKKSAKILLNQFLYYFPYCIQKSFH